MASSRKAIRVNKTTPESGGVLPADSESVTASVRVADAVDRVLTAVRAVLHPNLFDTPADTPAIAIALSGGLDSSVLLDATALVAGAPRCIAFHVHHGLSPNADAWLDHARTAAHGLDIAFDARRVTLARDDGTGIEAAARDARYDALFAMSQSAGARVLLLGHHADDQAETFLLQAVRGAGLRGLASMPVSADVSVSDTQTLRVARPLLHLPRTLLEDYARQRGLQWIDDESNNDFRYARNAARHAVLAPLAKYFPSYREGLARSARHAADAQALLDEYAAVDLQSLKLRMSDATGAPLSLSLAAWRVLDATSSLRAANALRYWIRACGMRAMSVARFDDLVAKLREAASDRTIACVHEGRVLQHYRDALDWSLAGSTDARDEWHLHYDGQAAWYLPPWKGTIVFVPTDKTDPQRVSTTLLRRGSLRATVRGGGERMRVGVGRPSRTLKNLFQEAGVPAWRRDVPVIFLGGEVVFVPGLGINVELTDASSDDATDWVRFEWRPDLLIA
jgi:tRNA(Ile)-lysidine synthase